MEIKLDDLQGPEINALLQEHLTEMYATSPPESVHALDTDALQQPNVSVWTIWIEAELAGCGALKALGDGYGEIKSMRTARAFHRLGVAANMLTHIIGVARDRGYHTLSLETGTMKHFAPAIQLYKKFGFTVCPPFADYRVDANSVYMTLALS